MKNNNSKQILLTDVPEKLRKSREIAPNVPYELHEFCDYIADIASDELSPEGMILLVRKGVNELKEIIYDLQNTRIICYLSFFPLIIDKTASKEFSVEFRKLFIRYLGDARPPLDETKEDFGVTILEEGLVDISNKDKAEVLASLYNNSHPHGMGFLKYKPEDMTIEEAKRILNEQTYFDYLFGRVMKVDLSTDIVCTSCYNKNNGKGAAERAISQCRNIR